MPRDLRATDRYREIEGFFRRALEPGFGRITAAAEVSPSPDGGRIAFAGSMLEALEGLPATRICVADVAAGSFDTVTGGPNSDRQPRWSPDGNRLSFLSDREREHRFGLYLLDPAGDGEPTAGPEVPGSVEYHAWSADGASILLGVADEGADLAGVQGSGTVASAEPDLPPWMPAVEAGDDDSPRRRAFVVDVASGGLRQASREGLNVWEASWCGLGRLAAIVSEAADEGAWYRAPLALVDVASGAERILLRSEVQLGLPAGSPSGRRLAVVEALCSDRMVVAGDILLVDPESGDAVRVDALGVDVTSLAWRDDDHLVFAGVRGRQTVAGEVDATAEQAVELWVSDRTCGTVYPEAVPAAEGALAVALQGPDLPPTPALIHRGEAGPVCSLDHDGTAFLREGLGSVEPLAWAAPDGLEIQGLLWRPEGEDPHPTVVQVHGGPIGVTQDRWAGTSLARVLVSRGYAVLLPNPRGSSGRGQAFASMVYGDAGGGDAGDILAGVDAVVERGIADPSRLGVTGASYGGFMTCWLVTRTDRFAAAVAVSPVTDWYSQHFVSNIAFWDGEFLRDDLERPGGEYFARSPVMFAGRVRTPTLLTAGALDGCTPPNQAVEFYRAIRERGVDSELALYPQEGHGVRRLPAAIDFATRALGWFERYMPAG